MRSLVLVALLTGCLGPQLDIVVEGEGDVLIDDGVAPFSCSDECGLIVDGPIALTAKATAGSTFLGWEGGACSGTGACLLEPSADTAITARFERTRYELSVSLEGTGSGVVTSGAEIDCGTDCNELYGEGSGILLTAVPGADSRFTGWSGACAGASPMCLVTLTEAKQVTATFTARNPQLLTVTRSGTGLGRIAAAPIFGIDCGNDCTEQIDAGTVVTLAAFANEGSSFTGWSGGGCSGTGSCTTTVAAATTIDAAFAAVPYVLSVMRTGSGSGTVTSSPAGIDCGSDCSETYPSGTQVTLTATAAAGSTFMGWSGGLCNGNAMCVITVDHAFAVAPIFKNDADPFMASSVTSMTTDTAGGVYTTWIGAWANVTTNKSGDELGILLPFDEPNTQTVETQYYYQRSPSPTQSVLAIGPSNGGYIPAQILTVVADTGTIQVYMPAMTTNDCVRTRFYVAADGSTYHSRADHDYTYSAAKANIPTEQCYSTWGVVGPDLTPAQAMVPQHLARAAP